MELLMNRDATNSILLSRLNRHYAAQTRRPAMAIFWMLPLLLVYEIWAFTSGRPMNRSGIEWLMFSWAGFVPALVMPAACLALVAWWHRRVGDHWDIDARHLGLAAVESLLLGAMIYFATCAIQLGFTNSIEGRQVADEQRWLNDLDAVARFCGTSVFEEIVFRFLLMMGLIHWFARFVQSSAVRVTLAVILSSLLFSAFHYSVLNPAGDPFEWLGFVCRFLVGIAFTLVYLRRGLSIAVLAHLFYNLMFLIVWRNW